MDTYALILDELRACARAGKRLPNPEASDLYQAAGGDGLTAVLLAVEYETALGVVKMEMQEQRLRDWRTLREVAA